MNHCWTVNKDKTIVHFFPFLLPNNEDLLPEVEEEKRNISKLEVFIHLYTELGENFHRFFVIHPVQ